MPKTEREVVTVWVAWHRGGDEVCITESDVVFDHRRELTECRYGPKGSNYARRFVAIDSLPEPLRSRVRKAVRRG